MKTCWRAQMLGLVALSLLGLTASLQADGNPSIWGPGPGLLVKHFLGIHQNIPTDPAFGFVPTTWAAYPPTFVGPTGNLQVPSGEPKAPAAMPRADDGKSGPLLPEPNAEKPMTLAPVPGHFRVVTIEVQRP